MTFPITSLDGRWLIQELKRGLSKVICAGFRKLVQEELTVVDFQRMMKNRFLRILWLWFGLHTDLVEVQIRTMNSIKKQLMITTRILTDPIGSINYKVGFSF